MIDVVKALHNEGTTYPFEQSISLENDILPYADGQFCEACVVTGTYRAEGKDIVADATVTFAITCLCDRCGTKTKKSFSLPFHVVFAKTPQDDSYGYEKNEVPLQQAVADEIVLDLPSSVTCREDCKGLCPKCFCNRNETACSCEAEEAGKNNPFAALREMKF